MNTGNGAPVKVTQTGKYSPFDKPKCLKKISSLRVERANLLNFETHAHYVLDNTMAKTPEAVYDLLDQLWQPALLRANKELEI